MGQTFDYHIFVLNGDVSGLDFGGLKIFDKDNPEDLHDFIENRADKIMDGYFNNRKYTVKDFNTLAKKFNETVKNYDKDNVLATKTMFVHELSPAEKIEKKQLHNEAVALYKEHMKGIFKSEYLLECNHIKGCGNYRADKGICRGMNISPDEFYEKSNDEKLVMFNKLLEDMKKITIDLSEAKTDRELLDYIKNNSLIFNALGEVDGSKLPSFIKDMGINFDSETKEKFDDFMKNFQKQAMDANGLFERITMMANPYYAEVNMNELVSLCVNINEAHHTDVDDLVFQYLDDMGENSQRYKKINKTKEMFEQEIENGNTYNVFTDLYGLYGVVFLRDTNLPKIKYDENGKNPNEIYQIQENVPQNLKFYFYNKGGVENVTFYDPKTGEEVAEDQKEAMYSRIGEGEYFVAKDAEGNIKLIGADDNTLKIDVRNPETIADLSTPETRKITADKILKDLSDAQTMSLTASKEFKALNNAVKEFASNSGSDEKSKAASEKIAKAAKDYLNFRRFSDKARNDKTYIRMKFAEDMVKLFDSANGLNAVKEKNLEKVIGADATRKKVDINKANEIKEKMEKGTSNKKENAKVKKAEKKVTKVNTK